MCGTLTTIDLSPTGFSELNSIYSDTEGRYRIMGALVESDFMGKACQIRQNSLYDFLMATAREWGTKSVTTSKIIGAGTTDIMPFVRMGRNGPINNNFWNVTSGVSGSGTSPGGAAYNYTANLASQTSIPADLSWFPARTELYITGITGGGTKTSTQYTVVDAVVISATVVTVYCVANNASSFLSGAQTTTPASGYAMRGVPNVSPYESYCAQIKGLNTRQHAWFWMQDTRWTICNDAKTDEYLAALRMNNGLFREFGDVEQIVLNKQIIADQQNRMVYSFFFNKPLPNQDPNNWGSLEIIEANGGLPSSDFLYLPSIDGRQVARRANAVGIYEQLAECGRVFDAQNQVLNIPEFLKQLYIIQRAREDNSIESNIIEVIMDQFYAVNFKQGFFRYQNLRYEGNARYNFNQPDSMKQSVLGFQYEDIKLDYPSGLILRIVTHKAFDDLVTAAINASMESTGRMLLILDLGQTTYQAVIQSESIQLSTGDIKTLAAIDENMFCRMKTITKSIRHFSKKYTNVVECPLANLWIDNLNSGVPEYRDVAGNPTDLVGALS